MNQEEQEVKRLTKLYRAFGSRDVREMEGLGRRGHIQCGHPGWRILGGMRHGKLALHL
jgi:hypothetical protein